MCVLIYNACFTSSDTTCLTLLFKSKNTVDKSPNLMPFNSNKFSLYNFKSIKKNKILMFLNVYFELFLSKFWHKITKTLFRTAFLLFNKIFLLYSKCNFYYSCCVTTELIVCTWWMLCKQCWIIDSIYLYQ